MAPGTPSAQEAEPPCLGQQPPEDTPWPWLAVTVGPPPHRVVTPHYSSGLLIAKSDAYTKVYSRAGLSLMWNGEDALMVGTVGGAGKEPSPGIAEKFSGESARAGRESSDCRDLGWPQDIPGGGPCPPPHLPHLGAGLVLGLLVAALATWSPPWSRSCSWSWTADSRTTPVGCVVTTMGSRPTRNSCWKVGMGMHGARWATGGEDRGVH